MTEPIITLTTDFGEDSPYVAAMKGVILGVNPQARIVDLSHHIPPQDVWQAAFFLGTSIPYFPRGVIHVVVVDPGVGSARALLHVEVGGHCLLAPDNGCWTELERSSPRPPAVRRLTEACYWRHPMSRTFHGRDILAPVAGWLSRGLLPEKLGPLVAEWIRLETPAPVVTADRIHGVVVFVDHYGNLISNIPGEAIATLAGRAVRITVGDEEVLRCVQTYAEAEAGTLVALVSSSGRLEVAVAQGSAARRLQAGVGTPVTVMVGK